VAPASAGNPYVMRSVADLSSAAPEVSLLLEGPTIEAGDCLSAKLAFQAFPAEMENPL
jgi:hypothetical protein